MIYVFPTSGLPINISFSFFWSVRIPKIVDFYEKDNNETIYKSITKGIQIVKFVISLLLNASMWRVFARPMNEVMHHLAEKMKVRWLSLTWFCVWTRRELSIFLFESLTVTGMFGNFSCLLNRAHHNVELIMTEIYHPKNLFHYITALLRASHLNNMYPVIQYIIWAIWQQNKYRFSTNNFSCGFGIGVRILMGLFFCKCT